MQQFLKLGQEENEIRQVGQAESKGDGTESCTYSGLCTIPTSALKLQHRVMVFFYLRFTSYNFAIFFFSF